MASEIQKINGSDVISKSYEIINNNFDILYDKINSLSKSNSNNLDRVKSISWSAGVSGDILDITLYDDSHIYSKIIPEASINTNGILTNREQLIGGDKRFNNNIILNDNSSQIKGDYNNTIISQDGTNVYIGGKDGIIISYDTNGNFKSITCKNLITN